MDFCDGPEEEGGFLSTLRKTWIDDSTEDTPGSGSTPPPTRSSALNELYALGMKCFEERGNLKLFKLRLDSEMLRFYGIYKNFLETYYQAELPQDVDTQAKIVLLSLQEYEKALEEIKTYFDSGELSIIGSGLKKAVNAINTLTFSYDAFVKHQSDALTKKCILCGHPNSLGSIQCSACESPFTLSGEEIPLEFTSLRVIGEKSSLSFGAASFPGSIIEVYDNFLKYTANRMKKEKYLEEVDWAITQFEISRQHLERSQATMESESFETMEGLLEGTDRIKKSLEKIRDAIVMERLDRLGIQWNNLISAIHLIYRAQSVREGPHDAQ
ncbi:MAG: hypothetical protein RDV48_18140 [Candidatus Eremiobacteraeota bacterium]|nr:hypothetical protein [Candidatus Eremiobacteraeota bacterium]